MYCNVMYCNVLYCMYVCVFIIRFPLKGVLQVNGVRARAQMASILGPFARARGPLSHRGPFPMEIVFYVSICKHIQLYIIIYIHKYIYIYIHTHIYIYMYVSGFVQSLPTKI